MRLHKGDRSDYLLGREPAIRISTSLIEPPDEHAGIQSQVSVAIAPDGTGSELVIRHEKLGRTDAIERSDDKVIGRDEPHGRDPEDDQELVASVRAALAGAGDIREVRMFGGIGFMLNGNLVAGASRRGVLLRVGKDRQAEALAKSGVRPMVMRGRTMEGYVYVDRSALEKQAVQNGLRLAVAYVQTLPLKAKGKTKQDKGRRK